MDNELQTALETGELPLFEECCDDQDLVVEMTEAGSMDKCRNCGEYQ